MKAQIIQSLPEHEREQANSAFAKLSDIEFSLSDKNRQKFTNQIHNFRREITSASYEGTQIENPVQAY